MKIAIHKREGSFSDRWIPYCEQKGIDYKVVNCFDDDIIEQLADCEALMWHHHHGLPEDVILARQLSSALQHAGKKVFPDFNTAWHFDDKLGQKYLFELFEELPSLPTHVFFDKKKAESWVKTARFPAVFKLRRGASSINVSLVRDRREALKVIDRAFGRGFKAYDDLKVIKDKYRKVLAKNASVSTLLKALARVIIRPAAARLPMERDYVYFQDFVVSDGADTRVVVIGDRATSVRRLVRENDFRASGSNRLILQNDHVDKRLIEMSFEAARVLRTQSLALDFIRTPDDQIYIVEISYGFGMNVLDHSTGYFTSDLEWHAGPCNPETWMVDLVVDELTEKSRFAIG